MLMKFCSHCHKEIPYGHSMCEECQRAFPVKRKKADKDYNRFRRDKQSDKFYHSKEWKALSKFVLLRAEYKCAECDGLATEVHHKKAVADDWDERLNVDNLVALCTACHNKQR